MPELKTDKAVAATIQTAARQIEELAARQIEEAARSHVEEAADRYGVEVGWGVSGGGRAGR